jgi:RHS repeat-associated protein
MSIIFNSYNDGGHLDKVFVNIWQEQAGTDLSTWTAIVTNIDYNAKKQLTAISYSNGTTSTRTYDPFRFRLERLQTSWPSRGALQDLRYTYDLIGNITHIRDDAQQSIYFRNARVDPSCDYTYDALYRLAAATGREHLRQTNCRPGPPAVPRPLDETRVNNLGDGNAMGTYAETYVYDKVGNILSISRASSDSKHPSWKCTYSYNESSQLEPGKRSNRLSSTTVGSVTENYRYDVPAGSHGNITAMPHLPVMRWDFRDQLSATSKQIVTNGSTLETTYYVYDSTGHRIRKVTERQSTPGATPLSPICMNKHIYLDSLEIFRNFNSANGVDISLERVTLKVKNTTKRVALIEIRTQGADDEVKQLIRFQLDNQLESACIEVDDQARIIFYEEFFSYGSTSYHAVANLQEAPKRYRYSGKERDEESGMCFYSKRYYAPWLGRWISPDPKGLDDGTNVYWFVKGDPVTNTDVQGTDTTEARLTLTSPDLLVPRSQGFSLMTEKLTLSPTPLFTPLPQGSALEAFKPQLFPDPQTVLSPTPSILATPPQSPAFSQAPPPSPSSQPGLPSLPSLSELKVDLSKNCPSAPTSQKPLASTSTPLSEASTSPREAMPN